MEVLDLFNDERFSMTTITQAVNKRPWLPNYLGSLGLFTPVPIRTTSATVIINDHGEISVVQTTERGDAPREQKVPVRSMRQFPTPRIAVADTINAAELQNMLARAFMVGGDVQTMAMQDIQAEMAFRLDGPTGLRAKQETTKERMRLGAICGQVLDADDTVLYDWPAEFGVSLPAEIPFDLKAASPAPGVLLTLCQDLGRKVLRAAKAGNNPNVRVIGLCGDEFFDDFRAHPDYRNSYQYSGQEAAELRMGRPFGEFDFGGIHWVNFRGTDDVSPTTGAATVGILPKKCKFIPVGVPGLFQEVLSPYEGFDYVNTPGLPLYTMVVPDRDRGQFVRVETYSYPLYIATRPDVLFSATSEAEDDC